ncbi:MAG: hypothetical protein J7D61_13685, partial [Marichromatium sp.]|nr:hypothetical protein [Marichromatium sp.]
PPAASRQPPAARGLNRKDAKAAKQGGRAASVQPPVMSLLFPHWRLKADRWRLTITKSRSYLCALRVFVVQIALEEHQPPQKAAPPPLAAES